MELNVLFKYYQQRRYFIKEGTQDISSGIIKGFEYSALNSTVKPETITFLVQDNPNDKKLLVVPYVKSFPTQELCEAELNDYLRKIKQIDEESNENE